MDNLTEKTTTRFILTGLLLLLISFNQVLAQNFKQDSSLVYVAVQDTNRIKKIDSVTNVIGNQLNLLQEKAETINKTVNRIDDNTNDSYFTEVVKNYSFSLIYELLGYKSGSMNSLSKFVSILSFLFLLIKILFFFSKGDRYKVFKILLNGYFFILAFFVLLLPWTSQILPNNEADKSQIVRTTKYAKELNDELEKIKSSNFDKLKRSIKDLEALRIDTFQFTSEKNINNIDEKLSNLQQQLSETSIKIDSLDRKINTIDCNKSGFQSFLAFLTFLMVLVLFIWIAKIGNAKWK
jgi:hypothetical protein